GVTRHLAVCAGKDKHLYTVNRDNMGKFVPNASSNANIYQDIPNATAPGSTNSKGTVVYFNNTLYIGGPTDSLKAYRFSNAKLTTPPAHKTTTVFGYPGTTPSISANGTTNGIVWAEQSASGGVAV